MNAHMTSTILLLTCFLTLGCGLDQEYTGLGERSPIDRGDDQCVCNCDDNSTDNGVLDVDTLESRLYRFTSVALSEPFGDTMNKSLNDYFAQEIEADNLHILLKVTLHAGSEIRFEVGNGTAEDDGYLLGVSSELICSLTGARFQTTTPAQLEFPVAEGLLDPAVLPIKALQLAGKFDPQGVSIASGSLVGALTLEDAQTIQVLGMDMASFLDSLKIYPDLDLDDDSANDAYRFSGSYESIQVNESGSS